MTRGKKGGEREGGGARKCRFRLPAYCLVEGMNPVHIGGGLETTGRLQNIPMFVQNLSYSMINERSILSSSSLSCHNGALCAAVDSQFPAPHTNEITTTRTPN